MNQFLSLLHKFNLALANWNHLLWFSKREELVETKKGPFFLIISGRRQNTSLEQQCIDAFLHVSLSYLKAGHQKKP